MKWDCGYGCDHEYPDDWNMGPNGNDPRADYRYESASYIYLNADMEGVWQTSVPMCDEQAFDQFTSVQDSAYHEPPVRYIMVRRVGEGKPHVLPFVYNAETDTVYPKGE